MTTYTSPGQPQPYPYRVRWATPRGTSLESFDHESQALAHYAQIGVARLHGDLRVLIWAAVERWSGRAWSAIRMYPVATS